MRSVSKVITRFPAFISHILFSGHTWSRGHLQVNRTNFLFGKMKSQHKMTEMRTFRGLLRYMGWTRWILAYWDLIWDSLAPSVIRQTDILRKRAIFLQCVCVCVCVCVRACVWNILLIQIFFFTTRDYHR